MTNKQLTLNDLRRVTKREKVPAGEWVASVPATLADLIEVLQGVEGAEVRMADELEGHPGLAALYVASGLRYLVIPLPEQEDK